jgi:hypothetical protein
MLVSIDNTRTELSTLLFYRIAEQLDKEERLPYKDAFGVQWENADNIQGGRLGCLFFFLELYRKRADPLIMDKISKELYWFDRYIDAHPGSNQSLFCGRLGLAYLYLELYTTTGERGYLNKSLDLLKTGYQGMAFQYGIIQHHALSDGIAGMLLISMHLYAATREQWILSYIEKQMTWLVHEMETGHGTMYWGSIDRRDRRNYGFSSGSAGLAFVFRQLGQMFDEPAFFAIARHALQYEDAHWDAMTGFATVTGISLSAGYMGRLLVGLYSGDKHDRNNGIDKLLHLSANLPPFGDRQMHVNYGLFDGWSGVGLAFTEAYRISREPQFLSVARDIAEKMIQGSCEQGLKIPYTLDGLSGLGYFLLRLGDPDREENGCIVMPSINQTDLSLRLQDMGLGQETIWERIIDKDFKHTRLALQKDFPKDTRAFLHTGVMNYPQGLIDLVARIKDRGEVDNNFSVFVEQEQFEKERTIFEGKLRMIENENRNEEEWISLALSFEKTVRLPDAVFKNIILRLSDKVLLISGEKAPDLSRKFKAGEFASFFEHYGSASFVYRLNSAGRMEAIRLDLQKLIIDRFMTPSLVNSACIRIADFLFNQGREIAAILSLVFDAPNEQQLPKIINEFIIDTIKYFFSEGILEIKEPDKIVKP